MKHAPLRYMTKAESKPFPDLDGEHMSRLAFAASSLGALLEPVEAAQVGLHASSEILPDVLGQCSLHDQTMTRELGVA